VRAVVRDTAALTARSFGGNQILTEHRRVDQALDTARPVDAQMASLNK
jgi:hypothetical protein